VEGDELEYEWENLTPCELTKTRRKIRFADAEPTFSTRQMSEIIIRRIVGEPVGED
jgi:hypothetical protein